MKHLVVAFVILMSLSLAVPDGAAQSVTEDLEGQVCLAEERYYLMVEEDGAGGDGRTGETYCGRGIPGARLTLHASAAPNVTVATVDTDEDGHFRLDVPVSGNYTVRVARTGFAPLSQAVAVPSEPLMLQPKPLKVSQAGEVLGRGPVADASVSFCCTSDVQATTGGDGTFTVQVPAGWHSIYVRAPGHYEASFDQFVDGAEAVSLQLRPLPPPDVYITGSVRDQDGAPVAGANVHTSSYAGGPEPRPMEDAAKPAMESWIAPGYSNHTVTGPDGTYRVGVMAGHVSVGVEKEGYAPSWFDLDADDGEMVKDVRLLRYPDRTARIEGRITDTDGAPLGFVSVHVESPLFGRYECSTSPAATGTSVAVPRRAGPADADEKTASGGAEADARMPIEPYFEDCAIKLGQDGTFSGLVTPGYSIVRVHYQQWQACDGRSDCQGYIPYVRTMDLAADETTRLDIGLAPLPRPSTEASGYLVDTAQGTGIADGHVAFSRLDGGGYGWATTDADGSYRIRLHPGTYEVQVWADGYLPWAGILEVREDRSFDVPMTPGGNSARCCMPMPLAADAAEGAKATRIASPEGTSLPPGADDSQSGASDYEDLGGGLGPYDAAQRRSDGSLAADEDAPQVPLVLMLSAVLLAALLLRRR